jgi:hypothetical protein
MTHIGQEFAFGAAALFGAQLGFRQLRRAIAHLAIQIGQQRLALVVQTFAVRQRFLQLLIAFVQSHGHLSEVVHQLFQLGRRLRRKLHLPRRVTLHGELPHPFHQQLQRSCDAAPDHPREHQRESDRPQQPGHR